MLFLSGGITKLTNLSYRIKLTFYQGKLWGLEMKRHKILLITLLIMTSLLCMVACSKEKEVAKDIESVQEEIEEVVSDTKTEIEEPQLEEKPEEEKPKEEQKTTTNKPAPNKTTTNNSTANGQKPASGNTQSSKYPYYIKVNRLANCVTIYKQDETGAYTVPIKAMVCSVGKAKSPTPLGTFKIGEKYTWRYLFGDQYGQYAVRITGNILFHSVPYSQKRNDALKTDYYNKLGVADSMGCIRLSCVDVKWIYDNCSKGTKVQIYDSSNPGPLGKPSAIKIDVNSPYAGWDPTDPNPNNPWRSQKPTISGVKDMVTTCGTAVDLLSHVSAKDWLGKEIAVTVSPNIDFNVSGEYQVVYSAADSVGNVTQITAKIIVQEIVTEDTDTPEGGEM